MEKRLFIIKNRTHYLVAKNYVRTKPQGVNAVFLTIRKFKGYKEFANTIAEDPDFKLIKVLITDQSSAIKKYAGIISTLLKVKEVASRSNYFDEIIFANYHTWMQHLIINQFRTKRKILLSDGTRILTVTELRKKSKSMHFRSAPFGGNNWINENIFNIKTIEHLHIYSPIKIEVAEGDTLEVFQFKASDSLKVDSNKIFFVGSPLVEIGYITQEQNLEYLKLLKEKFNSSEIYYFAHRREEEANLSKYQFLGRIIKNESPFEETLEGADNLPAVIISFQSSVLMNLPAVYPQIQFFYIPLKDEDIRANATFKNNYKTLVNIFEGMNETNFKQLELGTP